MRACVTSHNYVMHFLPLRKFVVCNEDQCKHRADFSGKVGVVHDVDVLRGIAEGREVCCRIV